MLCIYSYLKPRVCFCLEDCLEDRGCLRAADVLLPEVITRLSGLPKREGCFDGVYCMLRDADCNAKPSQGSLVLCHDKSISDRVAKEGGFVVVVVVVVEGSEGYDIDSCSHRNPRLCKLDIVFHFPA